MSNSSVNPENPEKPKWPLMILGSLLVLMVGIFGLLFSWLNSPERLAKAKLDDLLQDERIPQQSQQSRQAMQEMERLIAEQQAQAEAMGGALERLDIKNMAASVNGIAMHESEAAYELRFALENPDDAGNIAVKVSPRRIQISGKRVFRSENGRETGSSTFMQVFPTASEVLPEKVTRIIQDTEQDAKKGKQLVVIIPKKYPGQKPSDIQKPQELSPDVIRQLQQAKPRYI